MSEYACIFPNCVPPYILMQFHVESRAHQNNQPGHSACSVDSLSFDPIRGNYNLATIPTQLVNLKGSHWVRYTLPDEPCFRS